MTRALGRCLAGIDFWLTPRWNGPGMLRKKQENAEIRVAGKPCDGMNPGRSARNR